MQSVSTHEMGKLLQQNNLDKIVIITWNFGNIDPEYGPLFLFPNSTKDIIDYFTRIFTIPFIPHNPKNRRYVEKNALIEFDNENLTIIVTSYQSEGMTFVFFDSDKYSEIVQLLSPHLAI